MQSYILNSKKLKYKFINLLMFGLSGIQHCARIAKYVHHRGNRPYNCIMYTNSVMYYFLNCKQLRVATWCRYYVDFSRLSQSFKAHILFKMVIFNKTTDINDIVIITRVFSEYCAVLNIIIYFPKDQYNV